MPLIEATGVSKSFGGVRALRSVSFELQAGEVHALVGENGAGKSTLIRILTGALEADSGSVRTWGHQVAAIYQQPALFPELSVAENIGLVLEERAGRHLFHRIDWRGRRQTARELLERVGATIDPDRNAASLSLAEQQLVEIAKALGANARAFVMDEPTASLSSREAHRLFELIGGLRSRGAGVIYVSHRLDELPRIADRVTVLRDGEVIATAEMKDLDKPAIIRMMVGREISAVIPKRGSPDGPAVLELRNLNGVSLSVRAGEVVGLAGLVGAGRTRLARTIFGLSGARSGELLIRGKRVNIDSPAQAVRHGIAYVPEDRRRHGLVEEMTVAENTTLATLDTVSRLGLIDFVRERQVAERFANRLATKTPGLDAPVRTLSGGNQQKVVLSRWLAAAPSILILDEPTQGIDVGAKAEVHRLMIGMLTEGMAILLISSDLAEILGMSDRIAVMAGGAIRGVLDRAEATQEKILELALPEART